MRLRWRGATISRASAASPTKRREGRLGRRPGTAGRGRPGGLFATLAEDARRQRRAAEFDTVRGFRHAWEQSATLSLRARDATILPAYAEPAGSRAERARRCSIAPPRSGDRPHLPLYAENARQKPPSVKRKSITRFAARTNVSAACIGSSARRPWSVRTQASRRPRPMRRVVWRVRPDGDPPRGRLPRDAP
jgi:hypothetical protein